MRLTAKGQLISKYLFGIFNSPKKQTKKFDFTTMVPQVELFSFVFWENWRHLKRHFKIKWQIGGLPVFAISFNSVYKLRININLFNKKVNLISNYTMFFFFTFKCYANFDKIGGRFICNSDYCSRQIGALLRYSLPKIQQTKMLVTCQRFWDLFFYLGWSGSILQFRQNIIKAGSKSWRLYSPE